MPYRVGLLTALAMLAACTGERGSADAGRDALGPPPELCDEPVPDLPGLRCFSPLTLTLRAENTQVDEACFVCSTTSCDAEARAAFGPDGLRVDPSAPEGACTDLLTCAAACGCGDASCQHDCLTRIACTALNPLLGCLRERCATSCMPSNRCGDGVLALNEQCEPSLPSGSCRQAGLSDGTLACTRACRWETRDCRDGCCGDGRMDRGEQCDGEERAGLTCEALGYEGGALGCSTLCRLDASACTGDGGRCGDGHVSPFLDERCDVGASPLGSCADLGYASGDIGCAPDCQTHDVSSCVPRTLFGASACATPLVPTPMLGADGLWHFVGTNVGGSTRETGSCGATEGPEMVFELVFPPATAGVVLLVDLDGDSIPGAVFYLRESCDPSTEVACVTGSGVAILPSLSAERRYRLFVDGVEALAAFEVVFGSP